MVKATLLDFAKELTLRHKIGIIPVNVDKQPLVDTVIEKRNRVATLEELDDYFSFNGSKRAQCLAVLLDSPKPLVALDLDGNGLAVFQRKVLPHCSATLKNAINMTMRTRTPRNGLHITFSIRSEDFCNGIHTREYWSELGNGKGHDQINLMGTGFYLVERGPGYEPINGPECLVTLSKIQLEELLNVLGRFESETSALRNVCSKLDRYYQPTNRQNIALRVSGYLHKYGVPEYLISDLVEYLIVIVGGDEESEKRYQAVRDTCAKDANSDQVSGLAKLLETVNDDDSVIVMINQEFSK